MDPRGSAGDLQRWKQIRVLIGVPSKATRELVVNVVAFQQIGRTAHSRVIMRATVLPPDDLSDGPAIMRAAALALTNAADRLQ